MDFKKCTKIIIVVIVCSHVEAYTVEDEIKNSIQFSFDIYKSMFDENHNIAVSPISLRVLLSILYQISTDNLEAELKEKVLFGEKEETYNSQSQSFSKYNIYANVKIINKIYLANEVVLTQNFLTIVNGLRSSVEQIDFSQKEKCSQKMNSWVTQQTHGLIKSVVSPEDIKLGTDIFLLSTLYFNAHWKTPFVSRYVKKQLFFGIDGISKNVDMMFDHGTYKVAQFEEINASVLQIPYDKQNSFVFWVILPKENSDIVHLKDLLSNNVIIQVNQRFEERVYDIRIPIFEINSTSDGVEALKKLGVNSLFQHNERFMFGEAQLRVDNIKQINKFRVDTNGTDGSSTTYQKAFPQGLWPRFTANKPFIFIILETNYLEPIYIGHFLKP